MSTTLGLCESRTVSLTVHHAESWLVPFHSTHQESVVLPRIWLFFIPPQGHPTVQWLQCWVFITAAQKRGPGNIRLGWRQTSGFQGQECGKWDTATVQWSVDTFRLQERLPRSKFGLKMAYQADEETLLGARWLWSGSEHEEEDGASRNSTCVCSSRAHCCMKFSCNFPWISSRS